MTTPAPTTVNALKLRAVLGKSAWFRGSAPGVIADLQQQMDRLRAITGTAYPFGELCSIRNRIAAQTTTDTEDLL